MWQPLAVALALAAILPGSALADSGKLKAKERRALDIVSVSATGDESVGLVVNVTFKGNVQRFIGRGSLKSALVALILHPKPGTGDPAGLITRGAGIVGQTGRKTRSGDIGVLRDGRSLTFVVGGSGLANVESLEVKSFARKPRAGGRGARLSQTVSDRAWDLIQTEQAADSETLPAPSATSSCEDLLAMSRSLGEDLKEAESRRDTLTELRSRLEKGIAQLEPIDRSNKRNKTLKQVLERFGQSLTAPIQLWHRLLGYDTLVNDSEVGRQKVSDALRSLRLDVRAVNVALERNLGLRERLSKLRNQADALALTRCAPPPVGSGRLERDCPNNPTCEYLRAFVKSDQVLGGFQLIIPSGYSVIGAGGVYVNGVQVGSCTFATTTRPQDTLACSMPEQPANSEIRADFVTGNEERTSYKRLADGAGANLYLTAPRAAGPFSLTGP